MNLQMHTTTNQPYNAINMGNEVLKHAMHYAQRGWHVFPLKPRSKVPGSRNGFKDATTDELVINHWFADPATNIAIATGGQSGLLVVDADPRNGSEKGLQALQEKTGINLELYPTVQARTGGGGFHVYFQLPPGVDIASGPMGDEFPGLDKKCNGGYVVGAPSTHPSGGQYEWEASSDPLDGVAVAPLPEKLLALLMERSRPATVNSASSGEGWIDDATMRELQSALCYISSDEREIWINVGLALKRSGHVNNYQVWDEWSRRSSKYNEADQMRRWESFNLETGNAAISYKSIFHWAQDAGWNNPLAGGAVSVETVSISAKPDVVHSDLEALPAFLFNPPGLIKSAVEYINETAPMPQPVLALNAALCMLGAVAGRRVQSQSGLKTNLMINTLASSGTGKAHAMKAVGKILRTCGMESVIGGSKIASGSAMLNRLAGHPNTLFMLDEFGKTLQGITGINGSVPEHKRAIIENLLEVSTRADDVMMGIEYADQSQPRQDIYYPCLNLVAVTTPSTFWDAIDGRSAEDGLLGRFITCPLSDEQSNKVYNEDAFLCAVPSGIKSHIIDINNMLGGGGNVQQFTGEDPTRIMPSKQAKALLTHFRELAKEQQQGLEGTGLDFIWKRAYENISKLALVLAVADLSGTVEQEHAKWAGDYVNYWNRRFVDVAKENLSESPFHALEQEVLRLVGRAGGQGRTKRELTQYSRKFKAAPANVRRQVLDWLVESEQLAFVKINNLAGRGKTRNAFVALECD